MLFRCLGLAVLVTLLSPSVSVAVSYTPETEGALALLPAGLTPQITPSSVEQPVFDHHVLPEATGVGTALLSWTVPAPAPAGRETFGLFGESLTLRPQARARGAGGAYRSSASHLVVGPGLLAAILLGQIALKIRHISFRRIRRRLRRQYLREAPHCCWSTRRGSVYRLIRPVHRHRQDAKAVHMHYTTRRVARPLRRAA